MFSKPRWYKVVEEHVTEESKSKLSETDESRRDHRLQMDENVRRVVQPLKFPWYGRIGYGLMLTTSLLWVALLIILLYDYYADC